MQAASIQSRIEIAHSEEEALLTLSAAELLGKRWDFGAVRRTLTGTTGYDASLYQQMAELGWLSLATPAAYGGAGMPLGALASLAEPMGKQLLGSPFLATTLASQLLLHAGSEAQKHHWLPKLGSGAAIGSIALSEPGGSYTMLPTNVQLAKSGSGFTLSGSKCCALDAQHADLVLVSAHHDGRPVVVLLEASALAGRIRRETLIDETRRSAHIDLSGLLIGRDALLPAPDATAALEHTLRVAWLLLSAEMAGGAEGVMQLTLDYLKTRKQFGKFIGGYQALKHPMVEIMCAIEQGRSLLYHAATVFEQASVERELALRMAKAQLGDTYTHAADRSIQFHGAVGFTYECHAQLFFRRAQWAQHAFGDALHHRKKLGELMLRDASPF
jgi:alkylation response protein AidB-like acyl-CoA dehydrogenase